MYPRILLLSLLFVMSNASFAQDVQMTIGDKSARFMFITEAFGQDFGRLEMEAGVLYTEDKDYLGNVGLLVRGESVSVPIIVSLGARAYFSKLKNYTVGAVALGGDVLVNPEAWGGFGIGANYYIAPRVVSFNDAEDLQEYGAYLSYQITQQAQVSLGYRSIDVTIEDTGANQRLDNGGYFGLNLSF